MHELLSNPTGKGSAYGSARFRIKEDLDKRYKNLIYKYKGFQYRVYKVKSSYFFHFKIPSETYDNLEYDVIIEFYPEDEEAEKDKTINSYYVRVFSNSPAFMFTYTYVCYHNDLIPKSLIKFCSKIALKQAPNVRNPVQVYGYEKSVYFACLYIISHDLFKKFEIEKNLFEYQKDTWSTTVRTQEAKFNEYNKCKKDAAAAKKKAKADRIKKLDAEINKRNKKKSTTKKKKSSSSSTKRKNKTSSSKSKSSTKK
jgi:hypothetical protein